MSNLKKQKKTPKPKVTSKNFRPWTKEDDELLLNTESNVVAALLLKRKPAACSTHRGKLIAKGETSIPVKCYHLKTAKKIVEKILKEKSKQKSTAKFANAANEITERENQVQQSNLPVVLREHVLEETMVVSEEQVQVIMPLRIIINNQEMLFKNGINKLTIQGSDVHISVE